MLIFPLSAHKKRVEVFFHVDFVHQEADGVTVDEESDSKGGDKNKREGPHLGCFGQEAHKEFCVNDQQQQEKQYGNENIKYRSA